MAPDVFFAAPGRIVLMAESNRSLLESDTLKQLTGELEGPMKAYETWTIDVPSGAIVVALAYNATPEEGLDPASLGLDVLCYSDVTPRLPGRVPRKPLFTDAHDRRDVAVVPVAPGRYRIASGNVGKFLGCVIERVGAAKAPAKVTAKAHAKTARAKPDKVAPLCEEDVKQVRERFIMRQAVGHAGVDVVVRVDRLH